MFSTTYFGGGYLLYVDGSTGYVVSPAVNRRLVQVKPFKQQVPSNIMLPTFS